MTEAEADDLAGLSFRNRASIAVARACGCFYCLAVFSPADITAWVGHEQTALCPHCGIDSVLPDVTDEPSLRALHRLRFEHGVTFTGEAWQELVKASAPK